MVKIPGITAKHAIITPTCRANHGMMGAFDEAVRRLSTEYFTCQTKGNAQADFHLVLTVDRNREGES